MLFHLECSLRNNRSIIVNEISICIKSFLKVMSNGKAMGVLALLQNTYRSSD